MQCKVLSLSASVERTKSNSVQCLVDKVFSQSYEQIFCYDVIQLNIRIILYLLAE